MSFSRNYLLVTTHLSFSGHSLGASGALLAVIGIFGSVLPDSKLQIIFLPMFTFSASSAIKAMAAFDAVGCLAGWRFLDHAAHLGGLLFGVWYVRCTHILGQPRRIPIYVMHAQL